MSQYRREYSSRSNQAERQGLLDGASDEEDFFLNGPSAKTNRLVKDDKVNRLQGQVHEVIDVMQDNIGKVMDRGERLEDLQDKSDSLSSNSDRFRNHARGLRQQMWWKECKMRLIVAVVILIILTIIIVPIIVHFTKDD